MKILSIIFGVLGTVSIIIGRLKSINLTEGEALLKELPFWVAGVLFLLFSLISLPEVK